MIDCSKNKTSTADDQAEHLLDQINTFNDQSRVEERMLKMSSLEVCNLQ